MASETEKELLHSMINERDERIKALEKMRSKQEMSLIDSQEELHKMRIKQREESYWSRLNNEKHGLQLSSAEKRIKELERELIENAINSNSSHLQLPQSIDKAYVTKIHSHLTKSLRIIGVLDNQINNVKKSCDEIIKSLKAEVSEIMEDRSKVELDLLNQLANLHNAKQVMEDDLRLQLQSRQDDIDLLKKKLNTGTNSEEIIEGDRNHYQSDEKISGSLYDQYDEDNSEDGELFTSQRDSIRVPPPSAFQIQFLKRIDSLQNENENLNKLLKESNEKIVILEAGTHEHENTIKTLKLNLASKQNDVFEDTDIIDILTKDAEEAKELLEQICKIQKCSEAGIKRLEPQVDLLKRYNQVLPKDEDSKESLVSSFNNALLVQEQIKISLNLVELKLRNQLTAIRDGKVFPEFIKRVLSRARDSTSMKTRRLESNVILMIRDVEEYAKNKIKLLHEDQMEEITRLKRDLNLSKNTIKELETIIERLRQDRESMSKIAKPKEKNEEEQESFDDTVVDADMIDKLQEEVFEAVERLKQKNHLIVQLTSAVEEHKVREKRLTKELSNSKEKLSLHDDQNILSLLEKSAWESF